MPAAYWELSQSLGCKIGFSEKTLLWTISRASAHPSVVYYNVSDVAYLFHVAILEKPFLIPGVSKMIGSRNPYHGKYSNLGETSNEYVRVPSSHVPPTTEEQLEYNYK